MADQKIDLKIPDPDSKEYLKMINGNRQIIDIMLKLGHIVRSPDSNNGPEYVLEEDCFPFVVSFPNNEGLKDGGSLFVILNKKQGSVSPPFGKSELLEELNNLGGSKIILEHMRNRVAELEENKPREGDIAKHEEWDERRWG